ncbi:hypothetical protein KKC44_03210 [Patescibacteria group bacterium]|nr:hypothetical protein [Patescibacteria group bacterium]
MTIKILTLQPRWLKCFTAVTSLWALSASQALAAVYSGGGIKTGAERAGDTGVGGTTDLQGAIGNIVDEALTFVSLLAVTVIIIAGFYLILGLGNDSSKETAKKIIIYVIVGLLVIILSKAFVELIKTIGGV